MKKPKARRAFAIKPVAFNVNWQSGLDAVKKRQRSLKRHQLTVRFEAGVLLIMIVVALIIGLRLSTNPVVSVESSQFSQATIQTVSKNVRSIATEVLESKLQYRLKPFAPRTELINKLKTLPEVEDARLAISPYGARPEIVVDLIKIVAIYKQASNRYFLTSAGKAVELRGDVLIDQASLPLIEDTLYKVDQLENDQSIFSLDELNRLMQLNKFLEEQGSELESVMPAKYQINQNPTEVVMISQTGTKYVFVNDDSLLQQAAGAIVFERDKELGGKYRTVDARIVGRVVYR
ncbi:hypothetical protein H6798_02530 [Candidatus Nomurabacteria bacterium]|nr:hypothetical protein [Candidatus Nomurabacteria bacterium]